MITHHRVGDQSPLLIALGGLVALAVGMGIGRFVYTPILPPMMASLGLSKSDAGLIASANFAGYLAGAVYLARARLPGSRRAWLMGALLASAATTAAMGLTTTLVGFMGLRFLGGLASAPVLILSSALVLERLAETGRAGLGALHFAGVGAGIAASAAVVAIQLAGEASWAAMWKANGAVALFGALAVAFLVPPREEQPAAAPLPRGMGDDLRLRRMILACALFGFGYVVTATFLVAIVRADPAIRPLEPVIWIVVGLTAAPSGMLWTWLGHRMGTATAFATASLVEAVGVLASVVWPSMAGICLAAVLVGGTFTGLTALGLMRARELAHGDPRPAMAALAVAFAVGQMVGPAFAGVVSDLLGGLMVPSVTAAGALVLAACLAWARPLPVTAVLVPISGARKQNSATASPALSST
jgi:predicted MFS family arabinose efflux permease